MNIIEYHNVSPVAQDTHSQIYDIREKSLLAEVPNDIELLSYFYDELNNINIILSNLVITEEQALKELDKYNKLIKRSEFSELILSHESEISYKIKDIQESIEYY
ncbi:hypothetical protein, partial [Morganella morganii]